MRALVAEDLDGALRGIDAGHDQLARDRATLDTVAQAAEDLAEHRRQPGPGQQSGPEQQSGPGRRPGIGPGPASTSTFPWSIGQVASRLAVTSATLRHWERIGLLRPPREPHHGRRLFGPEDVRDAELVHLLRRAGHGLDGIAVVLRALREAPGTTELTDALEESREHLQQRGLSLLRASAAIADCLPHLGLETPRNLRV
jgi:DNA-binding transcriptional MerR regulator